jgi:xylulokinase
MLPAGTPISGVCVDSTSGTILPVDESGTALHPAILYNDLRSEPQVAEVQAAGEVLQQKLGYSFGSSYGLPKIAWLHRTQPDLFSRTRWFIHAADYINGHLTGNFGVSDSSNALKTGYDVVDMAWPEWIENELGIPLNSLPSIVLPGKPIGEISQRASVETGLPTGTPVYAGATDGTAAQIASGAANPGEWNTTLGTTLVFKGISRELKLDPHGRIYFHRHPDGGWMPGSASNTGTEWIAQDHPGSDVGALCRSASRCSPTRLVRYPLAHPGERFPFRCNEAQGFVSAGRTRGAPPLPREIFAAGMEGVALVERLAYDTIREIGLEVGDRVFVTGGGARSQEWLQIRASVLQKHLVAPELTETAAGAAVLAAAGCWFGSVSPAAAAMVKVSHVIEPDPNLADVYTERYHTLVDELKTRGYL